jgi:hypothetical protein
MAMNEVDQSKANNFFRITAVPFIGLLTGIVLASLKYSPTPFIITSGVITLLILILIIISAEIFDTISFGAFLQLKKEIARAEKEKADVKTENKELRTSLLSMATSFNQSQVTNNISGLDPLALRRFLGVVEASPEEKQKEKEKDDPAASVGEESSNNVNKKINYESKRKLRSIIEEDLIKKFSAKYSIPLLDIRKEVKIGLGIESLDPIMTKDIIYDAYVKTDQKEYFIEVIPTGAFIGTMSFYRLYVLLAKVLFYRQAKRVEAELVFIDVQIPEDSDNVSYGSRSSSRIIEWFQPAISNNLLRLENFVYSDAEFEILKERANQTIIDGGAF